MSNNFKNDLQKAVEQKLPDREIGWGKMKNDKGGIEEALYICNDEVGIAMFIEEEIRDFYSDKYIETITDKVVTSYNHAYEQYIKEFLDEYDCLGSCKDSIVYTLVNAEMNNYLKEDYPHKKYLDFLVVCRALIKFNDGKCVAIKISNSILEKWGITKEELFDVAYENINKKKIVTFDTNEEHIRQVIDKFKEEEGLDDFEEIPEEERVVKKMIACTLNGHAYGASVMLMPDKVVEIAKKYNMKNVYMFPSSTDEIVLIDVVDMEEEELTQFLYKWNCNVYEINRNQKLLENNKYLADAVYKLDMQKEEFRKVCELRKRE